MKRKTTKLLVTGLCLAMTVASCKKDEPTTPTTTTPTTPTTPTTTAATAPTPYAGNVDGLMLSLMLDLNTTTAGYNVKVKTENAMASFFSAAGGTTMVYGGAVSVNSIALDTTNNSYFKTASVGMTPSDLDFEGGHANWSIGGSGSVPAFTYDYNSTFPQYTGTVPEAITRSSGLTISLGSNLVGADSVIVFIAKGSTSLTRTFAGSASSATISASDLAAFPAVTDKSAILEIVPYKITTRTQSGKTYAFVKEYAAVRYVNMD